MEHYYLNNNNNIGYLELILGPMFSGKTTQTIQIYNSYKYIGKKICVVNFIEDTRYHDFMLSTHDKVMIPCILTKSLGEIWNDINHKNYTDLRDSDVIIINEGQFFRDLFVIVLEMVEKYGKILYICGLDGDFNRNKFGNLIDLIPYSDKITKLNALCSQCKNGKKGIFTHRISEEQSQIVIGVDNYKSLCRECYLNESPNSSNSFDGVSRV